MMAYVSEPVLLCALHAGLSTIQSRLLCMWLPVCFVVIFATS